MSAVYEIDEYAVRFWSSRPTTTHDPGIAVAGIFLYQGPDFRGYAYFYPDGTALTPSETDPTEPFIALHYNLSQMPAVLEVLREEQPIYLFEFGTENAGLMSGREPTGEEEGLSG